MGLSIPELTLLLFIFVTALCLWQTFRAYVQRGPESQ